MHQGHGTGIHPQAAFTVLELLVTLAIAAILLLTGVPAFQQFTWRQHMRAAVGNLHNDLLVARSEAVFRNVSVVACPGEPAVGLRGFQRLERWLDRLCRRQRRPAATSRRRHLLRTGPGVRGTGHQQLRRSPQHPLPARRQRAGQQRHHRLLRARRAGAGAQTGHVEHRPDPARPYPDIDPRCAPELKSPAKCQIVHGRLRRNRVVLDSPGKAADNTAPRNFSPVAQLVRAGDC